MLSHTALLSARSPDRRDVRPSDLVIPAVGHHANPPAQAYVDPAVGHLRTARGGHVLDGNERAFRRVYASGWAVTGARGVISSTMINAHAIADPMLSVFPVGDVGGAV